MSDIVIRAKNLSKRYRIGKRERYRTLRDTLVDNFSSPFRFARSFFQGRSSLKGNDDNTIWALNDVSLEIKRGEVVGIIGRNGAGKSTLLKILSRITEPTNGFAEIRGRVGSLLEVGTGFHPELTGRENIYLNGAILGMRKAEINAKFDEIVAFAETEKFLDTPVKHYSSGMRVRLAFAVAAYLEPEILLVDEVLAVGDAAFQKKCLGKMGDVAKSGRTILFVSHNMAAVQNLCDRAFWLENGSIGASGKVAPVVEQYLKSVSGIGRTVLSNRKDRQGNSRLKFVEFSVSGEDLTEGSLRCGNPACLSIRYEAIPPLHNVHISIGVFTALGEGALYLANDLVGKSLNDLPPTGALTCRFNKLSLLPGSYSVNLYCTVNDVVADWVVDAARFDVGGGDYFGTGKLPPSGYGTVVIPHTWEVVSS